MQMELSLHERHRLAAALDLHEMTRSTTDAAQRAAERAGVAVINDSMCTVGRSTWMNHQWGAGGVCQRCNSTLPKLRAT